MMEWIPCWSISMWIHFSLSSSVNIMLLTKTLGYVEYFCSFWRWGLRLPHRPQDKSERETWMRLENVSSCVEMIKIISPYIIYNESVGALLGQLRSPLIMKHCTSDNDGPFEWLGLGRTNFWFDWNDLIYTQINPGPGWKCAFAWWKILDWNAGEKMAPEAVLKGVLVSLVMHNSLGRLLKVH